MRDEQRDASSLFGLFAAKPSRGGDVIAAHVASMGERDLLFPDSKGAARRGTDWYYGWRWSCDGTYGRYAADWRCVRPPASPICPGPRFRDLRHTHKTMPIELGVPEVLQDDCLGHHPAGVAARYANVTPIMRVRMLDGLELLWTVGRAAAQ